MTDKFIGWFFALVIGLAFWIGLYLISSVAFWVVLVFTILVIVGIIYTLMRKESKP